MREATRSRQITYSLLILKAVKPLPSTKQTGKIFQQNIDASMRATIRT
jgi:hypothetical protein